jgi:hypothetical protein
MGNIMAVASMETPDEKRLGLGLKETLFRDVLDNQFLDDQNNYNEYLIDPSKAPELRSIFDQWLQDTFDTADSYHYRKRACCTGQLHSGSKVIHAAYQNDIFTHGIEIPIANLWSETCEPPPETPITTPNATWVNDCLFDNNPKTTIYYYPEVDKLWKNAIGDRQENETLMNNEDDMHNITINLNKKILSNPASETNLQGDKKIEYRRADLKVLGPHGFVTRRLPMDQFWKLENTSTSIEEKEEEKLRMDAICYLPTTMDSPDTILNKGYLTSLKRNGEYKASEQIIENNAQATCELFYLPKTTSSLCHDFAEKCSSHTGSRRFQAKDGCEWGSNHNDDNFETHDQLNVSYRPNDQIPEHSTTDLGKRSIGINYPLDCACPNSMFGGYHGQHSDMKSREMYPKTLDGACASQFDDVQQSNQFGYGFTFADDKAPKSLVWCQNNVDLNNIYAPNGNITIEIKSQLNQCSGIRTTTSDDEDEDDDGDGDGEVNSTTTWILVAVFIVVIISILSKPKSTSTGAGVVIQTGSNGK